MPTPSLCTPTSAPGAQVHAAAHAETLWGLVCSDAHGVALEGGDEALHAHAHVSPNSTDAAAAGSTARVSVGGAPHTPTAQTTSSRARHSTRGRRRARTSAPRDVPSPPTGAPLRAPQSTQGDAPARRCARGSTRYAHRVRGLPWEWGAPTGAAQSDTRAVPAAAGWRYPGVPVGGRG
ncbi:hypothetical protein B0H14DRAFT_675776 [Mycena olivaceomarginata]|nr:hypothetical protein B0H14DRAFT_675776 [Mycena olivaceomarginata]